MKRALIACALVAVAMGCGDAVEVRPIIDLPAEDSEAYPFDGQTESLLLALARAGDSESLQESQASVGAALELSDAPRESNVVVHLSGLAAGAERAYGRTCNLDLTELAEPEPHLYFSRVARWAASFEPLVAERRGAYAYADDQGNAIIVGGRPRASVEKFDATLGAFVPVAGDSVTRNGGALAPLGDGRALLVGGVDDSGDGVVDIELLNPEPEVGPQPGPRLRAHGAVVLPDGSVLVAGGEEQAGAGAEFTATSRGRIYSLSAGAVPEAPVALASQLSSPRAHHTMTLLASDVLIIGGLNDVGDPVGNVELYRSREREFQDLPGAVLERWQHRAVPLGDDLLILGGYVPDGVGGVVAASELVLFDSRLNQFVPAGTAPLGSGVVGFAVTRLPDGGLLITGGEDATGEPLDTAFIVRFDDQGRVLVSATSPMATPRAHHVATLLCDGTVLVVGGTDDASAPGAERYNPASTGRR